MTKYHDFDQAQGTSIKIHLVVVEAVVVVELHCFHLLCLVLETR
jgi:hypothetical protein